MNIIVCIVHSYEFDHTLHLINVIRYINCIVLVKVIMLYCRFQMLQCSYQWRSYTWAHMGPGPGEFLSALVNYMRSTYLNRNSIAVYRIVIKLIMSLIYDF